MLLEWQQTSPPHNLGEIVDGLITLIKNKDVNNKKLSKIIKGPDFPTGGELIHTKAIKQSTISPRLCGGMFVAIPTAIPDDPFNNKKGS